jgi:RNA polymerase sigma-B factor
MRTAPLGVRRLSRAEAAELQRAYHDQGDLHARERLIEAYLPLVQALAQRFANRGERLEDLVQVGAIGLIKAVDRFEPARGVGLATFATPNILGEMRRHLRDRSALIRVPRRQQETCVRVRSAHHELGARLRRAPTDEELVVEAKLTPSDLSEAVHVEEVRAPLSLAEVDPLGGDDVLRSSDDRVSVARGLGRLHRRERQAVRCRYFADMSQSEIAERLGISRTQTSRLLASGLAKLRADLDGDADFSASRQVNSVHGDSGRRQGRAA